jgi:hypothetical protein
VCSAVWQRSVGNTRPTLPMRRTQLIVSVIARALEAQGRGSGIRGSSGGATAAAETALAAAAARASPHAFNAPFAAVARAATAVDNRFVLSKRSHWAASSLWCRTFASSAGGGSESGSSGNGGSGSGSGGDAPAYHPRDRNMAIVFTCKCVVHCCCCWWWWRVGCASLAQKRLLRSCSPLLTSPPTPPLQNTTNTACATRAPRKPLAATAMKRGW